jgi:hypothetical protein
MDDTRQGTPATLGRDVKRRSWLALCFRCGVYLLALGLIGVLAKITWASSRNFRPIPLSVWIQGHYRSFGRGWPWEFASWTDHGLPQTITESEWSTPKLIGDCLVFIVLAMVIACAAAFVARRRSWSMAALGIVLTMTCLVCGWLANTYHRSVRDKRLARELANLQVYPSDEFAEPRWISRLTGETGSFKGLFYRLSPSQLLYPPNGEWDRFFELMPQMSGVQELDLTGPWRDDDVRRLLQLPNLQHLQRLKFSMVPISDDALIGIESLRHLRALSVDHSNVSDATIERIAQLPRLEALRARRTEITEKCLPTLRRMAPKTEIDIRGTKIGDYQKMDFRRPTKPHAPGDFFL